MTFPSLEQALHAGFQVCNRTERGYRVVTRTAAGWLQADVVVSTLRRKADAQHGAVIEGTIDPVRPGGIQDPSRRIIDARLNSRSRASQHPSGTEEQSLRIQSLRDPCNVAKNRPAAQSAALSVMRRWNTRLSLEIFESRCRGRILLPQSSAIDHL
jgi:hypothetical protein